MAKINQDTKYKMKARYWVAVMYTENMIDGWQDEIAELVQLPFAYCVHDKDVDKAGNPRKPHVHVIIAFPNTTTYKRALEVFKRLEAPGHVALPNDVIESIVSMRHQYDYLIHDTEDSRKKHKYAYDKSERITGNGFDIGVFEQIGIKEKEDMADELCDAIITEGFTNFIDFYTFVKSNFDRSYLGVIRSYSGLFERMTKGNYQKMLYQK